MGTNRTWWATSELDKVFYEFWFRVRVGHSDKTWLLFKPLFTAFVPAPCQHRNCVTVEQRHYYGDNSDTASLTVLIEAGCTHSLFLRFIDWLSNTLIFDGPVYTCWNLDLSFGNYSPFLKQTFWSAMKTCAHVVDLGLQSRFSKINISSREVWP